MSTQVRLIVIRHGETNWNQQHRYQGQSDTELCVHGEEQARRIGNALRYEELCAVYCSHLTRAVHTAEIALAAYRARSTHAAPTLRVEPDIAEMDFGAWEGSTHEELLGREDPSYARWIENPWYTSPPEGEDLSHYARRVRDCFARMVADNADGTVAVITHGGVIRLLVAEVLDSPSAAIERIDVAPGSITRITYFDEAAILTSLNETGHLLCEFFM